MVYQMRLYIYGFSPYFLGWTITALDFLGFTGHTAYFPFWEFCVFHVQLARSRFFYKKARITRKI